ncbi:antitoxin [Mycobacterium lacus]|uniref:Putative antitoxin VapB37 n=1 Tax=Mycobacterium lacus TaxID=169765 RepID=A0A1X1Y093_9MYCO|nr:antitoxin [Mycobacterium lacus]MCV7122760.1 antitoxin [Mycobacterium lacus]ORW04542.1 antitoxin [Mycobacterium lacus]BBX96798.1 putative antitoxin VapB37 [Mycobacterium lacus]
MRTTVTLDDDVEQLVRRRMAERQVSFKKALNDAIRDGASRRPEPGRFVTRATDLGVPGVNLDRALQLAAELEDEELVRRQRRGS